MKFMGVFFVGLLLSLSLTCQADTVVHALPDKKPGQVFGGMLGFMIGSIGGPVGAIVGGGSAWLAGGKFQEVSGITGKAYGVERKDGSLVIVRSPNRHWQAGDKVRIVNQRLVAAIADN